MELSKEEIATNVATSIAAAKLRGDVRIINGEEYYLLAGNL